MTTETTHFQIRTTMINDEVRTYLLPPLFNAAVRAGAAIMKVYKHFDDYDISMKDDKTPITVADREAHRVIREYLGPTRIPVLSEEGREMRFEERRNWELYWLVDPLDGTVEFIKGNNEFTVNIALMENNICMGAVIYVPYFEKMYIAWRGRGSFLKEQVPADSVPNTITTVWRMRADGCRWSTSRRAISSWWRCRGRTRRPKPMRISTICADVGPIWKWWSRVVPTNFASWPKAKSIIMSVRRRPTNGIRPRAN